MKLIVDDWLKGVERWRYIKQPVYAKPAAAAGTTLISAVPNLSLTLAR